MFSSLSDLLRSAIFVCLAKWRKGIKTTRNIRIKGRPIIEIKPGAVIEIGKNVLINSQNRGYHLNMYGPCKLMADVSGARIVIGDNTRIHGSCIHAKASIVIGRNCLIAANTNIIDSDGHDICLFHPQDRIYTKDLPRPIIIGNNVWIGAGSLILPGSIIGDGCMVAAGSIVKGQFSENLLIGGIPARKISDLR